MKIEITKTDYRELLTLIEWSAKFVHERQKSTREDDKSRRLNRIMSRLIKKNKDALLPSVKDI